MIRAATLALLLAAPATAAEPSLPSAFDAGWHGQKVCELLFDNAQMRAARCTFPPGVGHERHFHAPHWGYIVQGATMRITTATGTTDRVLKAGESWWSDGIDWHEGVNIGTETGVYIIVEPKTAR
ncbi:cupin domain-containing protein [Polymorphobacter arshaanensis]|uniref:Cupin domain-containing protein n=1 Tax=Glacieibacterium arshaanense TaxID=2511025 RepID=A0A4Y9EQZ2_9SPHN|nr:cupin domain-containing protein [Polymorphobacter arshaanensis]TFU06047.1 cupin domain-containing protein [Polymorphobacter arshaanensis]